MPALLEAGAAWQLLPRLRNGTPLAVAQSRLTYADGSRSQPVATLSASSASPSFTDHPHATQRYGCIVASPEPETREGGD